MKIAIEFKNHKEEYIKKLEGSGFFSSSSLKAIWIYGVRVIYTNHNKLVLESEKEYYKMVEIDFKDMEYFEIHKS